MAFRPITRKRGAASAAIAMTIGALLPTRPLHLEAPSAPIQYRKPMYDPLPNASTPSEPTLTPPTKPSKTPRSSLTRPNTTLVASPSPTDRLAAQIRRARVYLHAQSSFAEAHFNALMTRAFNLESSFTNTIASLAPAPSTGERVLPGALYVLVAGMAGSIVARNRNILLRASVPVAVAIGAGWVVLPHTMENVSDLAWRWESRFPVVRDNHIRARRAIEQVVREARNGVKGIAGGVERGVGEVRRGVEGVVSGKK